MKYCPICRAKYPDTRLSCPVDGMRLFDREDPLVGKVIADRYEVLQKIGSGGMASVFKVRDAETGWIVALKALAPRLAEEPSHRIRFLREAKAARCIDHPNIVQVLGLGETEAGLVFMIMEHLDGPTLAEALAAGPFTLSRAVAVMLQIVSALGRAHELDVIHRDIKPDNVILISDGSRADVVKILDFGLARMKGDLSLTATGQVFGTPEYISPEQATGAKASPASDQYAAGIVFYEMLTGRPPFIGKPAQVLLNQFKRDPVPPSLVLSAAEVPEEVDLVILRMLAKSPHERYPTTTALLDALHDLGRLAP